MDILRLNSFLVPYILGELAFQRRIYRSVKLLCKEIKCCCRSELQGIFSVTRMSRDLWLLQATHSRNGKNRWCIYGFRPLSAKLNHLCVTPQFQTETNQHKSPQKRMDENGGKLLDGHEEGNEALILFGSVPNNLSLAIITSLKSQRGSNLMG